MQEAEILFRELLKCERVSLHLNRGKPLDKQTCATVSAVLKRRLKGEPLAYILGKAEFMGLGFKINPGVLIPRQETEILVETALKYAAKMHKGEACGIKIMDVGTGSGCIAVSLAKFFPQAQLSATDISKSALAIAQENARLNAVDINFIESDFFNAPGLVTSCPYDLMVSNPPYIASLDIDTLQPEISYEPRLALDGGRDGLDFYRKLSIEAQGYLKGNGFLIIEIGFRQRKKIENIFQKSKNFEIIEVIKDYSGIERVMVFRKAPI